MLEREEEEEEKKEKKERKAHMAHLQTDEHRCDTRCSPPDTPYPPFRLF